MQLKRLFEARSIAIIGASRDTKKVGASILANLRAGGFPGALYPVNPKASAVQGLKCYGSVTAITKPVDIAVIAVPAAMVEEILRACGTKKIPFAIIVTAGFGELGVEGKAHEQRVQALARKYKISILGPNCLGIIATGSRMNASFAGALPKPGSISCVSQSGALLVSLIDWSHEARVGMRTLVSIGNQAGISELAVLNYLAHDPHTSVIGMYAEQISDGPAFMKAVALCSRHKPVVVLKAGLSHAGSRAVSSHTGSLAGSAKIMSALLAQAGAIQAYDVEDFFRLLELFSYKRFNSSRSVAVLTNAGGPGIITTDILSRTVLQVAELSEKTTYSLRKALPLGAAVANPIDVMGDADLIRFKKALSILETDTGIGVIVVIVTPQRMTPAQDIARYLGSFQKRSKKQIIACFIGGAALAKARRTLTDLQVMHFEYPYDALRILSASKGMSVSRPARQLKGAVKQQGEAGRLMSYASMQRLLLREGFPLAKGRIIQNATQVKKLSGFPLVLKVLSSNAIHKAQSGALALNVATVAQAKVEVQRFIKQFKGSSFEGILAQPMIRGGKEFILGLKRDPIAGMVLLFGIGGSLAEELDDTAIHIGALKSQREAKEVIEKIRNQHILHGVDSQYSAMLLKKLSDFGVAHPEISELDFNPVLVYRRGGTIIDARIFTQSKK